MLALTLTFVNATQRQPIEPDLRHAARSGQLVDGVVDGIADALGNRLLPLSFPLLAIVVVVVTVAVISIPFRNGGRGRWRRGRSGVFRNQPIDLASIEPDAAALRTDIEFDAQAMGDVERLIDAEGAVQVMTFRGRGSQVSDLGVSGSKEFGIGLQAIDFGLERSSDVAHRCLDEMGGERVEVDQGGFLLGLKGLEPVL